jgi:hypothetical protein
VLVEVLEHLLQLGKHAAAVDGDRFVFLEAGIGETRQPGGDVVGMLVEIVG